jgi:phage terminase large subunit-like protein
MRYFFNLACAIHDPDNEGCEFATMGDARLEAARHAGELLRDRPGEVWNGEELRVEVTDSNQLVLFTLITLGVDAPAGGGRR